jgi:hypothetical protein
VEGDVMEETIADLREIADTLEREGPVMLECVETLRAVGHQLDYLQNLWSKEGITDGLACRIRDVLAKVDGIE